MGFQEFKTKSNCVEGRHHSFTTYIVAGKTINKKTGREIKLLIGPCSVCKRKNSLISSEHATVVEGVRDFFKSLGKISFKTGRKLAKSVLKNLGRASEIGANIGTAVASRNPKTDLSSYLKW